MKVIKIRLYPNKQQTEQLNQHIGSCRFLYNWGLSKKIEHYNSKKESLSTFSLMKEVTQLKKDEKFEWLKDVNAQSLQQSLLDLDKAYIAFFKKQNSFPKFKSKKRSKQSFCVPQNFKINEKSITIPKIKSIKFRDKFDFDKVQEYKQIRIVKKNDKFYACISYIPKIKSKKVYKNESIGIDLGVKALATLSTGTKIDNPRFINKFLKKIGKHQKNGNKRKAAKAYEKLENCRHDYIHKVTTKIAENQDYDTVVIEDMDIQSILKTGYRPTNRSVMDCCWRMFINLLEYKCVSNGKKFVKISSFEGASKTCSCGAKNHNLKIKDRIWTCKNCNVTHDRDILAAQNIKLFGTCKSTMQAGARL